MRNSEKNRLYCDSKEKAPQNQFDYFNMHKKKEKNWFSQGAKNVTIKEMSTKKILFIAIMLVAGTALLTGLGTLAYFSAIQTSGTNLLTTGSITISVNGQDPWIETFNTSLQDMKPCLTRWANASVTNTGQNDADLWMRVINVTTDNGSTTSAEALETAAWDIDGVIRFDLIQNGTYVIEDADDYTVTTGTHGLATTGINDTYIYMGNIPSGSTWTFNQSYTMDCAVTNWAQTDNMTFKIQFYAQQSQGTPQPAAPTPELAGHARP